MWYFCFSSCFPSTHFNYTHPKDIKSIMKLSHIMKELRYLTYFSFPLFFASFFAFLFSLFLSRALNPTISSGGNPGERGCGGGAIKSVLCTCIVWCAEPPLISTSSNKSTI